MKAKSVFIVSLVAAFTFALTGCPNPPNTPCPSPTPCPTPTSSCEVCVDFEPPLAAGTQYGTPVGQAPGTVIFTTNGIPVSIHDFNFVGSGGTFNLARIELPPAPFSSGQSIRTNNINLEFDFSAVGFPVSQVQFDFLDQGGIENISVNGSPIFAGNLPGAPSPIGGANIAVASSAAAGGTRGTVILMGSVNKLRVGGQEFWLDRVCARK